MNYAEGALRVENVYVDMGAFYEKIVSGTFEQYHIESSVFGLINEDTNSMNVISASNIDQALYKGGGEKFLSSYIEDGLKHYPKPHVSKISKELYEYITSIEKKRKYEHHSYIMPILYSNKKYIFVGFCNKTIDGPIPGQLLEDIKEIVVTMDLLYEADKQRHILEQLQIYIKEIGHDIASQVQAIISKLNNVINDKYHEDKKKEKIREAYRDVMGTMRIAKNMGLAVDPEFRIKIGGEFDILRTIKDAIGHHESEAAERHINISLVSDEEPIIVWGDQEAIEIAFSQYLINAIKYAYGSTYIQVNIQDAKDYVRVDVTDKGIPIEFVDLRSIWELGVRGENAKEKHVNGSGIGLYTVKKIIRGHEGQYAGYASAKDKHIVTFYFTIPKKQFADRMS